MATEAGEGPPTLPGAVHGKWYDDACGTAFGMELLGERWSLLVVRELMLGGRRFTDLRARLPGLSAKVLTERLTSLEAAGVLVRRRLPPPAAAQIYELTAWGYQTEPLIQELGRWAARSPDHNTALPLTPVGFILSLRTMFNAPAAAGLTISVGLTIEDDSFLAEIAHGRIPIRRAGPGEGDIGLAAATALPLVRIVYGNHDPADAVQTGAVVLRGDIVLARRFAALFALPPKVASREPS